MIDPAAYLEKLAERRPVLIDLGLDRMRAALDALGRPQDRLPPTIHVAGTNGKGSTCAYLRAMLEAADKSVHVYTSPHLVRFNERIVVAGREIDDERLIDALTRCDRAVGSGALTFFEATTAAAFLAFADTPADYLVLEVGLGGRLDATNVIAHPLATAITPIGFDHTQFLGDTLAAIAYEKGGIFRAGAPAVIGQQAPAARRMLEARAIEVGAPTFVQGADWDAFSISGRLIYQDEDGALDFGPPALAGVHQFANAGLAIAALRAANAPVSEEAISRGLANARWPARLQRLTEGPIVASARAAGAFEVFLDGAHNPHAAYALAASLAAMNSARAVPLAMVVGMQATKDAANFFVPFKSLSPTIVAVQADHRGAASADEIVAAAARSGLSAITATSLSDAARVAAARAGGPARLIIAGSLYLAGEVLKENR